VCLERMDRVAPATNNVYADHMLTRDPFFAASYPIDGLAMLGEDFRKLTPAQLDAILPRLQVLARSSPEDKHILVQRLNGGLMPETEEEWLAIHPGKNYATQRDLLLPGYKEEWAASRGGVGEVVGVTGDGTNDAPALKAADVGLSMGLSGTDVAKKASDIIIMDDNFSSIVKAVLWGRSVFDNIRKFLQFQLTVNVVALTITFMAAVAGYQPPLNAVMMLWVNLIMDTMGALALGTEPPSLELLDRRPYRRDASLISRPMWRNILCQATYQLIVLVYLLNRGPQLFFCEDGSRQHFTIIFNAFVFCQVFNEFNAREIGDRFDPTKSLSQSPMFLMVIAFTVVAQWLIVEYGADFTQTYPLNWEEWKFTVSLGAGSLPVGFIMRMIPVTEAPHSFAGIERKNARRSGKSLLTYLLLVLIPVLGAIVYQLYWEIDEFAGK
jgi:magnesium-transporting ATPase (P-type)